MLPRFLPPPAPRPLDPALRASLLASGVAALRAAAAATAPWPNDSVYSGAPGVALALASAADAVDAADGDAPTAGLPDAGELRAAGAALLGGSGGGSRVALAPTLHLGSLGAAAAAAALGQPVDVAAVVDVARAAEASLPAGECELLFGRAGVLAALCFIAARLPPDDDGRAVALLRPPATQLAASILREGSARAAEAGTLTSRPRADPCSLAYEWHGTPYLGAAHGLAGILTVLAAAATGPLGVSVDPAPLAAATGDLLSNQDVAAGGLPSHPGGDPDRLVQWCHGSPAICHLAASPLPSLLPPVAAAALNAAVAAAARHVAARGNLTKGVSLCHGTAGTAAALLAAWRATGDAAALAAAAGYAAAVADGWRTHASDSPNSLYEGIAGAGALLVWMALAPARARMVAYEDF